MKEIEREGKRDKVGGGEKREKGRKRSARERTALKVSLFLSF